MKKALIFMNTDRIGGAERSLLLQLLDQHDLKFTFIIPNVSGSHELQKFISSYGFNEIQSLSYPKSIYSLSRKNFQAGFRFLIDVVNLMLFGDKVFSNVNDYEYVYINGVKAALFFFLANKFRKIEAHIVWHFRDYWFQSSLINRVWRYLISGKIQNLAIVSNSQSTLNSLQSSPFKNVPSFVVYNPSGMVEKKYNFTKIKKIGIASMFTPWKGIHEVLLWAKLYEKELMKLGIEEISFYGTSLYQTNGHHNDYENQMEGLSKKLNSKLIKFKGLSAPSVIFNEIDCLIHYSLDEEPFGRVIVEAFLNCVPVISTSLGGASELVIHQKTGLVVSKYDLTGLFKAVEQLVSDPMSKRKMIETALEQTLEMENGIKTEMKKIFSAKRVS